MSRFSNASPPARSSGSRAVMSSPETEATRTSTPSRRASSRTASASASGSSPPALETTVMPRSRQTGSTASSSRQERARVPTAALPCLVQDVHGELGQPVTREHVERTALDHLPGCPGTITEEPAAVGHPQHARTTTCGSAHGASNLTRRSFTSTCWPGAHATSATVPAPSARSVCSIFMASRTTSGSPSVTVSPAATTTRVTDPGRGARHSPAMPPVSSGSSSLCREKEDCPSGPFTSTRCDPVRTR